MEDVEFACSHCVDRFEEQRDWDEMARGVDEYPTPWESRLVLHHEFFAVFALGTPNLRECGERADYSVRRRGLNFRTIPANRQGVSFVCRIQARAFLTTGYLDINVMVGISMLVKRTAD
jgi:hypothetical protein